MRPAGSITGELAGSLTIVGCAATDLARAYCAAHRKRSAGRRRCNADLSRVILIARISAFCYGPFHNKKSWEVF
jgi:hypothetical protein